MRDKAIIVCHEEALNNLRHLKFKNWQTMQIYVYVNDKSSTSKYRYDLRIYMFYTVSCQTWFISGVVPGVFVRYAC